MKKLGLSLKPITMVLFIFVSVFIATGFGINNFYDFRSFANENNVETVSQEETKQDMFISDLSNSYLVTGLPYGVIKDKTNTGANLSIKMENGASTYFTKGLFTPTEKRFIYNISNLDYKYFYCYIGVQSGSSANAKAVFSIDLSNSATGGWQTKLTSDEMSSNDIAKRIVIDLGNYSYMRLRADFPSGSRTSANAVWADARFTDNNAIKFSYLVKPVDEYDSKIKNDFASADLTNKEYELCLLQRNFISKFGTNGNVVLHNFILASDNNSQTFNWLFNNVDVLRMYTMGGMPDNTDMYKKGATYNTASWSNSLKVLAELYGTYKEDLADDSLSSLGNRRGDIYQKMMISLSLTHSRRIRFWIYDMGPDMEFNPTGNDSSAKVRYEVFKKIWLADKLDNNVFENLEVEEMRLVMNTLLPDNEIEWLLDFWKSRGSKGPYTYMVYRPAWEFWSGAPQYYDPAKKDYYYEKYKLDGYGIEYKKYITHAWMMFETGGVCWNLSNMGTNMTAVWGHPSIPLGQTGYVEHVAYADYYVNSSGQGYWALTNDVFSWLNTNYTNFNNLGGSGGWYTQRAMLDWGIGSYASSQNGTYLILAQAAMNDFANYEKSQELNLLAGLYADNLTKQEEIYRKALEVQNINLNSWLGLINNYSAQGKSGEDYISLARKIADALKYYPLPMCDLLNLIARKASAPEFTAVLNMIKVENLTKASKATESQVLQSNITRFMANSLLGKTNSEVAVFAFDGEGCSTLSIGKMYETSSPAWEYSIDGGTNWVTTDQKSVQFSSEQTKLISVDLDIKVHIIGTQRTEENTYVIDITKANAPEKFYLNDWENKIFGFDETMEWRFEGNLNWTKYSSLQPDLSGDKVVLIRRIATGTVMASDEVSYTFSSSGEDNSSKKYIPIKHLSVKEVSSEAVKNSGNAVNIIDGNYNTRWHSDWNGNDKQRYIIIEFDQLFAINAMDYIPAGGGNGKILNGKIYGSGTGEYWTELASVNWAQDEQMKTAEFLDNTLKFKYIKIVGEKCSGSKSFITGRMFNFYHNENASANKNPTADIEYSIKTNTNNDVTVQLVNSSTGIIVTNNNSRTYYTFTQNGSFTFEFKDANGLTGTATAVVDYIDKILPTAQAVYSETNKTNKNVTVTLTFSEDVIINNNNGKNTYTFTSNGEFTFYFSDMVGNQNTYKAKVENIFNTKPNLVSIDYSSTEPTKENVIVTFTLDREVIETTTSQTTYNKTYSYTFTQNASRLFRFADEVGNFIVFQINITCIDRTAPVATIAYSTTDPANKVIAYISFNEENVTITNNNGLDYYTFTENGKFTFEYVDRAGNVGKKEAVVNYINKNITAPEVIYDINTITNKNVTASLVVDGKMVDTHIFSENGTHNFNCTVSGKTITATAFVSWIDKKVPEATITYSSQTWSRFDIVASIFFDETDVEITNNNKLNSYTFTKNGTFTFAFKDKAGNEGTKEAEITWIFKEAPKPIVSYNLTQRTNQNVVATLDFECPKDVSQNTFTYFKRSITINNNFGSNSYTFTENGSFTFEFVDGAGNKGTKTVSVDYIDKTLPVGKLEYSTYDITRDAVEVVISFDKQNVSITNNSGINKYVFDDNGSFTFEYQDELGNKNSTTAVVSWINKNLPIVNFVYDIDKKTDKDVTATINFDSATDVVIVNNNGNNSYTFSENGTFTFEYVYGDENFASATVEVTWIKKTISIKYLGDEGLIKEDVIAFGSGYQILNSLVNYGDKEIIYWTSDNKTYNEGDILSLEDDLVLNAVYFRANEGNTAGDNSSNNADAVKISVAVAMVTLTLSAGVVVIIKKKKLKLK